MAIQSAGILLYRSRNGTVEVLLTHPGGPFWAKKDSWSITKGETEPNEDLLSAAKREFQEETSFQPPEGDYLDLGQSKQGSKTNYIWGAEGDFDMKQFKCTSMVKLEWPPHSGQQLEFPENDRAQWFGLAEAKQKLFKAQAIFIDRLAEKLGVDISDSSPPEQASLF